LYKISTRENYLLVEFEDDFDNYTIKSIIHHVTWLTDYSRINDIWLIGKHRSLIAMDDIDSVVAGFKCRCPRSAFRKKTAIVVSFGLTDVIMKVWVKQARNKLPFEFRVFHKLEEAEEWLGVAEASMV
jgi:hypothetical protein